MHHGLVDDRRYRSGLKGYLFTEVRGETTPAIRLVVME